MAIYLAMSLMFYITWLHDQVFVYYLVFHIILESDICEPNGLSVSYIPYLASTFWKCPFAN